jgi:hypothetical protein
MVVQCLKRNNMKKMMKSATMKMGGAMKKAKSGTEFGMLSVKAGVDKNPNPTAADRIAGAKKMAKSGAKVKKAMMGSNMTAAPIMKKGGSMKKCKYGCK